MADTTALIKLIQTLGGAEVAAQDQQVLDQYGLLTEDVTVRLIGLVEQLIGKAEGYSVSLPVSEYRQDYFSAGAELCASMGFQGRVEQAGDAWVLTVTYDGDSPFGTLALMEGTAEPEPEHYDSLSELFSAIADAIREKSGGTAAIPAMEFPSAIRGLN